MKKLWIIALSVILVGVFTVPVMAVDHEFGGYWRTRMYNMTNFTGDDSGDKDAQRTDTRTRLYYTAVLSDQVKLVNKFEMDAAFGDEVRGDIGADGKNFEVKNSYADVNLGDFNVKLGTQGAAFSRGFLFDADFSGAIVAYKSDDIAIPFIWIKAFEGGTGDDANDMDFDYYGVDPKYNMGDLRLNPFVFYMTSAGGGALTDDDDDFVNEDPTTEDVWSGWGDAEGLDDVAIYYLGVNVDYSADMFSAWLTGIYSAGKIDVAEDFQVDKGTDSYDLASYLFGAGGSINLDAISVHGQFFYASGDDDGLTDDELTSFFVPAGQSYYWAEIMGYGLIDEAVSAGSPKDAISNVMAVNVGVGIPMDKLSLTVDIWNASLVEDDENGDTALGTEIDLAASYQLLDDLKLQVVAAYLAAGDATGDGDENPTEVGAQISLSF